MSSNASSPVTYARATPGGALHATPVRTAWMAASRTIAALVGGHEADDLPPRAHDRSVDALARHPEAELGLEAHDQLYRVDRVEADPRAEKRRVGIDLVRVALDVQARDQHLSNAGEHRLAPR